MPDAPDIKPRSRTVTDGIEALTSRGMLRAVGMGDADWDKPQIGIASSWNEITPCNLSLDRLAQASKEGVHSGGGYPLQFGTISVSDGISMGHEGMHFSLVSREVIADSVETVMQAERLDGSVLLAGCDKSLPGMLMAAARLDLASVFLYAGTIAPGWVKLSDGTEKDITIIDSFEAVGAVKAGKMSMEDASRIECAFAPGEGACGGMYTANTMASVAEALGMALPGIDEPAVRRSSPRLLRASLGRGRREHAASWHHSPRHPHQGGVRERDHGRDGAGRFDQRRAPPARDRARGRGPADDRRLQPHRQQGSTPRRHEAIRPLRHERSRPARRHPGADEGAAGCRTAARRLHHRDRQDGRREPRRSEPGSRSTARCSTRSTTPSIRPAA